MTTTLRGCLRMGLIGAMASLLAACGGGQGNTGIPRGSASPADTRTTQTTASPVFVAGTKPSAETIAAQQDGARLNREELARIAKNGVLPKASGGKLLSGANQTGEIKGAKGAKAATTRTAVYRFFNTATQAHFFTTDETERDRVRSNMPNMSFEDAAFYASNAEQPGLSPVYRFYNTQTGVHFYTISEDEKAHTLATLPQFQFEGIAYYASTLEGSGYTPLYRFFYASKGFHFYTNSAAEKDNIIAKLPQYTFEGVGYYMLGGDWVPPAVPHTGITTAQCYEEGNDALLVDCNSASAIALNPQQDGHRRSFNPMAYSNVPGHEADNCLLDTVTGLIWERSAPTTSFSNLGNGALTDASRHVSEINSQGLCGFSDWRLPTVEELLGIANYGMSYSPRVHTDWFLDTSVDNGYWSSEDTVDVPGSAFSFSFKNLSTNIDALGVLQGVRLVRGATWSGPRHMITNATYPGDAANNAVLDRKTGLIWRRCLEGQSWSGSTCSGQSIKFEQETAFVHANAIEHWRLPNIKELGSLADRNRSNPALDVVTLFPRGNPNPNWSWSSTPFEGNAHYAFAIEFVKGEVWKIARYLPFAPVRLVYNIE